MRQQSSGEGAAQGADGPPVQACNGGGRERAGDAFDGRRVLLMLPHVLWLPLRHTGGGVCAVLRAHESNTGSSSSHGDAGHVRRHVLRRGSADATSLELGAGWVL